jgi:hypothetical protein
MINVGGITFAKGCMCYTLCSSSYFSILRHSSSTSKCELLCFDVSCHFFHIPVFFTVHIHTFSSRLFAVEERYKVCVEGER